MKTKIALLTLFGMISSLAFAQEFDDMYFNRKDREKLRESMLVSNVSRSSTPERTITPSTKQEQMSRFNPTDSYSARNVNPDHAQNLSTSKSQAEYADDEYLPEEYRDGYLMAQTQQASQQNWYSPGFYGPRMGAWNSPYYGWGGMYDPWMMSPMWGGPSSMWSMSIGYGWGNSWGRNSMMWGNPWMMDPFMNPYNAWAFNSFGWGWDPWFNPYWGGRYTHWGRPMAWGNPYWHPTTVIIVGDNSNSHISRARRPSRSGADYYNTNTRTADRTSNVRTTNVNNVGRIDNTTNTRSSSFNNSNINRFDQNRNNARSNVTYPSRSASPSGVTPLHQQRNSNFNSSSPSRSNSFTAPSGGNMRSSGGVAPSSGGMRSGGGSIGSSSGGSRSRGGN